MFLDIFQIREKIKIRKLCESYCISGNYRRIYHFHVQKTGGTSINHTFCSLAYDKEEFEKFERLNKNHPVFGSEDFRLSAPGRKINMRLNRSKEQRIEGNGFLIAGWNKRILSRGSYFFGFSHVPIHEISLPKQTLTMTCLRDPVSRLISRYKQLLELYQEGNLAHYNQGYLASTLRLGFDSFVQNYDKELLLHQVYMFSKNFSPVEAAENVLCCNAIMFTESLNTDFEKLSQVLELNLQLPHAKKSSLQVDLSPQQLSYLREVLEPEYKFISIVKKELGYRTEKIAK